MNNTPTSDHFPKLLHCMNTACHDLRDAVHVLDYVILHVEPHTPANGLNGRVHPPHHCQVLFLKNSSTSCSQTFLFPLLHLLSRELEMIFALHLHRLRSVPDQTTVYHRRLHSIVAESCSDVTHAQPRSHLITRAIHINVP